MDTQNAGIKRLVIRKDAGRALDLVEVQTFAGVSGYGEGCWGADTLQRSPELLIGRSPFEAESIFEDLSAAGPTAGGVDMAIWDAAARLAGRPLCTLFGKTHRSQVRIASSLCIDGIEFLEEPLPPADVAGYRRLKDSCTQPVAAGRNIPPDILLRDFIQSELIDLALPDIVSAGVTGLRRLAYFCWLFRVRLAVACPGSALATAAALHAAACFVPVTSAIAAPAPFLLIPDRTPGFLPVPTGVGLGMDPDWLSQPPDFTLGD